MEKKWVISNTCKRNMLMCFLILILEVMMNRMIIMICWLLIIYRLEKSVNFVRKYIKIAVYLISMITKPLRSVRSWGKLNTRENWSSRSYGSHRLKSTCQALKSPNMSRLTSTKRIIKAIKALKLRIRRQFTIACKPSRKKSFLAGAINGSVASAKTMYPPRSKCRYRCSQDFW